VAAVLFVLALILYVLAVRPRSNSLRDWIILSIQVITFLGLFFLLKDSASRLRESGLLLTGAVTLLTTFALLLSASPVPNPQPEQTENEIVEVNYSHEPISNTAALQEQLEVLSKQLAAEKYRNTQLILLNELSQQLEAELDPPVSAQLAVNTLERAIECSLVALFVLEADAHEFVVLASAGKMTSLIPPGYQQNANSGLLGRTIKFKKTNIVNDTRIDSDFVRLENDNTLSIISVPILQHGHVKGVLEICADTTHAFSSQDAVIAEGVATELLRSWERSSYLQHITELTQAGISPRTLMMDPQASVQEVAAIARNTLEAKFVFVTLLDQNGNFSRTASAGEAPRLLATLNDNPLNEPLLQAALNATKPFRVRDVRKYSKSQKLEIDHPSLRSALAIPIRLYRFSIGTIIAFGKQDSVFFSERDESLADLLSSQAGASIESSWLYQDLGSKESNASMLNKLSVDILQTEELNSAAELIARAAHEVTSSRETGIVLLTRDGHVEAQIEIDANGLHTRREHPMELITQAIESGQHIIVSIKDGSLACYPLLTRRRIYGALWMQIHESGQNFANIKRLADQAAIAVERTILLAESRHQAKQLEAAYAELELTYDRTLTALMSALDARDRETEGHSTRVSRLSCLIGEALGLTEQQLKALERGALLHDIGKIGISDTILHKPGKLTEDEWRTMRIHPDIGERIVEGIPFLQVIRYHHERWNGSGYPLGLQGAAIPIQARIFAVADVFDALTSNRTYRKKSSPEEAIDYIKEQAGILFDPDVVEALQNMPYTDFIQGKRIPV
jgi:HD-GYP domain-containing protein (c-di-GMP phosphodiesterase class II)/putative methionine-R-sulfoxide reductase with GAF domain